MGRAVGKTGRGGGAVVGDQLVKSGDWELGDHVTELCCFNSKLEWVKADTQLYLDYIIYMSILEIVLICTQVPFRQTCQSISKTNTIHYIAYNSIYLGMLLQGF